MRFSFKSVLFSYKLYISYTDDAVFKLFITIFTVKPKTFFHQKRIFALTQLGWTDEYENVQIYLVVCLSDHIYRANYHLGSNVWGLPTILM